jgi:predicted ATPase
MFKLKFLSLKNFCGYRELCLDFQDGNSPMHVVFGPNGTGKSTLLSAIRILANPQMFLNRDNDLIFRKMTWHPDYDPTTIGFNPSEAVLDMVATFSDPEGNERKVVMDCHGVVVNELPHYRSDQEGFSIFTDADHPINMNKFQLPVESGDKFLRMAKAVYGLPVSLGNAVRVAELETTREFHVDFIVHKGDVKVHFRRMSDGERKIATLLRHICTEIVHNPSKIVLIDNVEMHIFFKRHPLLAKSLCLEFPDRQFVVTSHSKAFIDACEKLYGNKSLIDLEEKFSKDYALYNDDDSFFVGYEQAPVAHAPGEYRLG